MFLYPGQELIGCVRRSKSKIVNGVIYVVERVTAESVTVRMHEDYSLTANVMKDGGIKRALRPYLEEVKRLLKDDTRTPQDLSKMASPALQKALKDRITVWGHQFALEYVRAALSGSSCARG